MEKAANKLGKLRDERAVEPLLNYANISHNVAALDALVSIGGSKAAVALSRLYRSDAARIGREWRGHGMDRIGGPGAPRLESIWVGHIEDAIRKMKREDIFWGEISLCLSCGSEFTPSSERYLFNWNEIPGNDNERLIKYLQGFTELANWVKTAKIEKIEDGKTIKLRRGKGISQKALFLFHAAFFQNPEELFNNFLINNGRF